MLGDRTGWHLPACLDPSRQRALLAEVRAVIAAGPLLRPAGADRAVAAVMEVLRVHARPSTAADSAFRTSNVAANWSGGRGAAVAATGVG